MLLSDYRTANSYWNRNEYATLFQRFLYCDPKSFRAYFKFEPYRNVYVPKEVSVELKAAGWEIENYSTGIAVQGKRRCKIAKLLPENIQKQFVNDPNRSCSRHLALTIVLCRHPYDYIRASSHRNWTSCQDLEKNASKRSTILAELYEEIAHGNLIAYLIHSEDTSIQNPLARVKILRYNSGTSFILRAANTVYGSAPIQFKQQVQAILDCMQHYENVVYSIPNHLVHDDSYPQYFKFSKLERRYLSYYVKNFQKLQRTTAS